MIVRVEDVRAAGLCVAGARTWFRSRGLDFRAFLRDGMEADALRGMNDPFADRAIAAAEVRHG